ncbi:HNH endonuclease [Marinobacter subterrani]|uniref:HNH endonuclease n=1 Tax=Marinobacter subterrani TaxID=1658765 RepID=A0A0J7JF27_9GAMM|nr:HNH endonuclease [Marinobacter subterrani]KMQ76386.1 HNH endonuclease [Marinobacter subterrani]
MHLKARDLEQSVSLETGLAFEAASGVDQEKQSWFELWPRDVSRDHAFCIRAALDWRRIRIGFQPGKFAGELLERMSHADEIGRSAFRSILADCEARGAEIDYRINGKPYHLTSDEPWGQPWSRFALHLSKGQLELGVEDGEADADIVCRWTGRFAAAVTAILPLEEAGSSDEEMRGYPEGALTTVQANRFERDRRNRAAAIAIHGTSCLACGIEMGSVYGGVAQGFIEIHHVTPVSQLGAGYLIDPAKDLVPLCPNCHAVAHRRSPPFSVDEIRHLIDNR